MAMSPHSRFQVPTNLDSVGHGLKQVKALLLMQFCCQPSVVNTQAYRKGLGLISSKIPSEEENKVWCMHAYTHTGQLQTCAVYGIPKTMVCRLKVG